MYRNFSNEVRNAHSDINGASCVLPPRRNPSCPELPTYCLDDCFDAFKKMSLYDVFNEDWDDEE
mgnify:FL=1